MPLLRNQPPKRILCASPYARDTIFNGFRSCTLLRNQRGSHKKERMRKPPMRAPMRGPRSSKEIDRAPCFEISPKNGTYAQGPYARNTIFNGFRSCTLLRNQPKEGTYAQGPYAPGLDAWGPRRLGALGAWAPGGLGKALLPPPSSLLLLPAKPYARPYAR